MKKTNKQTLSHTKSKYERAHESSLSSNQSFILGSAPNEAEFGTYKRGNYFQQYFTLSFLKKKKKENS